VLPDFTRRLCQRRFLTFLCLCKGAGFHYGCGHRFHQPNDTLSRWVIAELFWLLLPQVVLLRPKPSAIAPNPSARRKARPRTAMPPRFTKTKINLPKEYLMNTKRYCDCFTQISTKLVLILYALSISFSVRADNQDTDDGFLILKQTALSLESTSFYAELDWGGIPITVTQKKAKNGGYLVKMELESNASGYVVTNEFIYNENGMWSVLPDIALRMDFMRPNNKSVFYGLLQNKLNIPTEGDYRVKKEEKDGREIYLVTQTFRPPADGNIVEQTFFIGCNDHMLYGFTSKVDNGTITEMTVKKLKPLNSLSDDFFNLPAQQFICTNGSQLAEHTLPWVKKMADSPSFRTALLKNQEKREWIRRIILGIMLISPIILGYYLLHHKRK
jgi:outer membrane lipoprotein-sorting protein